MQAIAVEFASAILELDTDVALKDIEHDVRDIKTTLGWHWKIGASIASLFLAAFAGLVTWYLPKELANERRQTTDDIKIAIGKVLAPALQQLVLPEGELNNAPGKELQTRFQRAASIAQNAVSASVPGDQNVLGQVGSFIRTSLVTRKELPRPIRDEGLAAYIYIEGYATFSQNWMTGSPYSIVDVTFGGFGKAIDIEPSARGRVIVYGSKIINNGSQELDWGKWIKTDFENTKIIYHGGDVYLADDTFKNCTFEFGTDPASAALLARLKDSQLSKVAATALYARNDPTLSDFSLYR